MGAAQLHEDLAAQVWCESGANLGRETQLPGLVVAHEERVDAMRPRPVTADDEFLLSIQLELDPGGVTIARNVARCLALCDNTLESQLANRGDDLLRAFPPGRRT